MFGLLNPVCRKTCRTGRLTDVRSCRLLWSGLFCCLCCACAEFAAEKRCLKKSFLSHVEKVITFLLFLLRMPRPDPQINQFTDQFSMNSIILFCIVSNLMTLQWSSNGEPAVPGAAHCGAPCACRLSPADWIYLQQQQNKVPSVFHTFSGLIGEQHN